MIRSDLKNSPSWGSLSGTLTRVHISIDVHISSLLDDGDIRFILQCDASEYHKLGGKYYCTDAFLTSFLRGLVQGSRHFSLSQTVANLASKLGWKSELFPRHTGPLILSLVEHLMQRPSVLAAIARCRAAASKRVGETIAFCGRFQYCAPVRLQMISSAVARPLQGHIDIKTLHMN